MLSATIYGLVSFNIDKVGSCGMIATDVKHTQCTRLVNDVARKSITCSLQLGLNGRREPSVSWVAAI